MQAEGAQWVWHGHAPGSRVCEVVEDDAHYDVVEDDAHYDVVEDDAHDDHHGENSHQDDQEHSDSHFALEYDLSIFTTIAFGVGASAAFVCVLKHRRPRPPVVASPLVIIEKRALSEDPRSSILPK